MYPADVVPFLLAHAWIAGVAMLVGAFLGRVFPRQVPYAVLVGGLGVSAYFAHMTWLLEGSVWLPLGVFAIMGLGSLFLSAAVRYLTVGFEFALFWVGTYFVLLAGLAMPWATTTVDAVLSALVALACVAATEPLTRRMLQGAEAPEPVAPAATGRATTA